MVSQLTTATEWYRCCRPQRFAEAGLLRDMNLEKNGDAELCEKANPKWPTMSEETVMLERCLDRLREGDALARGELVELAFERLTRMVKKMKGDFDRLARWEQTEDVLQNAALRLYQALQDVTIQDARHFYRLAALQIRRELLDMCRHYHGPQGVGANHHTQMPQVAEQAAAAPSYDPAEMTTDPQRLVEWAEFHELVNQLPDQEREAFDLLWYHQLSQDQAAELMGLSTRQLKRIWRSAKVAMHDRLQGDIPL